MPITKQYPDRFAKVSSRCVQPEKRSRRRPPPRGVAERRKPRGQKVLDATIAIVRREGVESLTTIRIMEVAGFAQSSFYVHFRNVPECLRAAAEQVAGSIRRFVAEHRRQTSASAAAGLQALVGHYAAVLRLFEEEQEFAELFLRHRRDVSALGEVMRRLHQELRTDLEADLLRTAEAAGLPPAARDRVRLQADFLLAQVLAAGEAILDRRCLDRSQLAEELAQTSLVIAMDLIARYRS